MKCIPHCNSDGAGWALSIRDTESGRMPVTREHAFGPVVPTLRIPRTVGPQLWRANAGQPPTHRPGFTVVELVCALLLHFCA